MNLRNTFHLLIAQINFCSYHPFVQQKQQSFRGGMKKYEIRHSIFCHERWPKIINIFHPLHAYLCIQCTNDKVDTKLYYFDNNMHTEALNTGLLP